MNKYNVVGFFFLIGFSVSCVVVRQLPPELAADSDNEEVGEEFGPVLESGASDGCSMLEAKIGPGPSNISQLPSELEISGEEEQLGPVPDAHMRRAVRRGEQLGTGADSGRKTHVDAERALPGE
uniref:Secreted protein n=1 Tax=Micrurus spixii TaxID=129469 RepID=A0A2D4LLP4_9SAUR